MSSIKKVLAVALPAALLLAGITIAGELEDNERSAINALRTINTQQVLFRDGDKEQDGNNDYGMLSELSNTQLIDAVLGSGTKNGYVFTTSYSLTTSEFLWYGTASPVEPGKTGNRYFFVNTAGVIYESKMPFKVDAETCEVPKGLAPAVMPRPKPPRQRAGLVGMFCQLGGVDPNAKGCEDVAAGQVYTFTSGEHGRNTKITVEIKSKSEEDLVCVGREAENAEGHDETITFEEPIKDADKELSGAKRESIGKETLTVSGVDFECEILAIDLGPSKKGKVWVCREQFPFVIRLVDTVKNETILDLTEITGAIGGEKRFAATCACGAKFETGSRFCTQCGKARPKVEPEKPKAATCSACGEQIPADARFCPHCGAPRK